MQGILGERPKALADIQGRCVLDRLLDGLSPLVSQVSLVSNARFYPLFEAWAARSPHLVQLFNNGSTQADNRLGALGDLDLLLSKIGYDAPMLVVASDTVLDFSLRVCYSNFSEQALVNWRFGATRTQQISAAAASCNWMPSSG